MPPNHIECDHLAAGVNAGIGASGSGQSDLLAGRAKNRRLDLALNCGRSGGLTLKPEIIGSVIGHRSAITRPASNHTLVLVAINQFEQHHRRLIALARTQFVHTGVTTGTIFIARGQHFEHL